MTKRSSRVNASPAPAPSTFGFSTQPGHAAPSVGYMNGGFDAFVDYLRQQARVVSLTREDFEALPERAQKEAKNSPCVMLAKFDPPQRKGECIVGVTGLGLDVDKAHVELPALKAALKGTSAVIHESLRSAPGARRWRVFIEFARPATIEEHAAAFACWSKRIPGVALDVKDAPRLWYVPSRFSDEPERIIERVEGLPYQPASASPADPPGLAEASRRALLERVGPDARAPAEEGNRELNLTRFIMSRVKDAASEAELLALALEHNRKAYIPPLDESEVRAKVRRDWRKHGAGATEMLVAKRKADPAADAPPEGEPDLNDLFSTTAQIAVAEYERRREFVEDTLQVGCTLLHGPSKKGKSWAMLDMADHVAHGRESFLGRAVQRAKVLLIGAEDTPERFKDRIELMGIGASSEFITMNREQLKRWGERCAWKDDAGNALAWTAESFIATLHAQTGAEVIILDTQEVVEIILQIEHGERNVSLTRRHYLSTSSYDEVAQRLGIAVVLTAHWGAIRNLQLAVTSPHEMINTTKTKIAGALTSITLGPCAEQELNDDSGRMQWSVQGKDIRTGNRYEIVARDPVNQRHRFVGEARDVLLRDSLAEVMEKIESAMQAGMEWITAAELAAMLDITRGDTVKKKIAAITKAAQAQATRKGQGDGRVHWKDKVLESSVKGYRLVEA